MVEVQPLKLAFVATKARRKGPSEYGLRLAEAMQLAKTTDVAALAKACGVTAQAVYQVLRGPTIAFSPAPHMKAARYLKVDAYWLATGVGRASLKAPPAKPSPDFSEPDRDSGWQILQDLEDHRPEDRERKVREIHEEAERNRAIARQLYEKNNLM